MTSGGSDPNKPPQWGDQPQNQPPQWGQQSPSQPGQWGQQSPPPYPGSQQSYPGQQQPYPGQQSYPSAPPPAYGSQVPVGGTQPADLLLRFGARIIDGLIVGIPMWIVGFFVGMVLGTFGAILWQIIVVVVMIGYFAYFESTRGQTLGKQILNLRVVGPNGGNPTMEQAAKRNFFLAAGLLGLLGMFLPLGLSFVLSLVQIGVYIFIAVTIAKSPTKQGFHDHFAGDFRVVKTA